jgi:cytidylate kinase
MASHSIQHLVEMQGRRWARSLERITPPLQPSIAISRLRYSGAHEVAERIADRLGYGFFGSEIVDQIANDEGVRRELVAGLDEHGQNAIERYVIDGFRHRQFAETDYVRGVTRVISTLSRRGKAVILGRGAAAIVDPAYALRVLVVAPLDWRSQRLAAQRDLPIKTARERIVTEDRDRVEFHRRNFRFEQHDPVNYDLVVNTAALGIDAAAATILEAFRVRFRS